MKTCEAVGCKSPVGLSKKGKYNRFCSSSCKSRYIQYSSMEKRRLTCLLRYGTENPASSDLVKSKQKNTMKEKYGVDTVSELAPKRYGDDNCMRDPDVVEKRKQSSLEKYGVENPSQREDVRRKTIETLMARYGADNPLKIEAFKEKQKQSILRKYGNENYNRSKIADDVLSVLSSKEQLSDLNIENNLTQIATKLGVSKSLIWKRFDELNIDLIRHGSKSSFQDEVFKFISEHYHSDIIKNTKDIIGKELDLYLPDINLAIECNGTFFHSELFGGKKQNYHVDKTNLCEEKGIRLIHVFSHEWYSKKDIYTSIILNSIGSTGRVGARKCEIRTVCHADEFTFLERNHVQGYVKSDVAYGLYSGNELLSIMSFGKSRYNKIADIELLRFCNKLNVNVNGAASKLFKYYLEEFKNVKNIVSYSHRHIFNGSLYKKLGFEQISINRPSFYYTKDYNKVYNRLKFQKHKLKNKLDIFDENKTAWDNMKANGWDRYWDCGTITWKFDK